MLSAVRQIFIYELILSWRRSQEWLYPLAFFAIVMTLFPIAFSPDPAFLRKLLPGCVWIAALFACLLSVENVFFTDVEDGSLEQWLISSTPLSFLIAAKLSAQWLLTQLPLIILTPFVGFIFQLTGPAILALCISLLLGSPILILIGSLGIALTMGLRQQGILLGFLVMPLLIPVLIFGINIVLQTQAGLSVTGGFAFLAALSILAMLLVPPAIAATLRLAWDD